MLTIRRLKTRFFYAFAAFLALVPCLQPAAQALVNPVAMAFGKIDFFTPHTGSISLGTDGSVATSGNFSGNGIGVAGQLEITGTTGDVVEVSCANGTLAHSSGATLALFGEVVVGPGAVGPWGVGAACAGLTAVLLTHSINATAAENILFLGGRLTPTTLQNGPYSTANPGGAPLGVRAVVI